MLRHKVYLTKVQQHFLKSLYSNRKAHQTPRGWWTLPGKDERIYHSATVYRLMYSNLLEWVNGYNFVHLTDEGKTLAQSLLKLKAYP